MRREEPFRLIARRFALELLPGESRVDPPAKLHRHYEASQLAFPKRRERGREGTSDSHIRPVEMEINGAKSSCYAYRARTLSVLNRRTASRHLRPANAPCSAPCPSPLKQTEARGHRDPKKPPLASSRIIKCQDLNLSLREGQPDTGRLLEIAQLQGDSKVSLASCSKSRARKRFRSGSGSERLLDSLLDRPSLPLRDSRLSDLISIPTRFARSN